LSGTRTNTKSFNNNGLKQEEFGNYENIFNKYYEENNVLISDNIIFKNYIKSIYNIIVYDVNIGHLGDTTNLEKIH